MNIHYENQIDKECDNHKQYGVLLNKDENVALCIGHNIPVTLLTVVRGPAVHVLTL